LKAAVAAKPAPTPVAAAGASGEDAHLRNELKRYFDTSKNGKVRTYIPEL
jgi:hypothetical protein